MDENSSNQPPNDNSRDNASTRRVFTETFVFTGNGQTFFAAIQNIMNRIVNGPPPPPQEGHGQEQEQPMEQAAEQLPPGAATETRVPHVSQAPVSTGRGPDNSTYTSQRDASNGTRVQHILPDDGEALSDTMLVDAPPPQERTTVDEDDGMPGLEPASTAPSNTSNDPPIPRPIRPLPRNGIRPGAQPHAHFHAHTPNGTIDLYTFTVGSVDTTHSPQTDTGPSLEIEFDAIPGPDIIAGFEAFLLGMPHMEKEREPDIERAKVLLRGMVAVPEGLVRRLERAGGVPGGHGTEESGSAAGCAVCWGPLLDEVEPGEWEIALPAKEKEKTPDKDDKEMGEEQEQEQEQDEFQGLIVALPCAHVYHAQCLLPWFSRQTTCPTCRLDVDPDSLTWTPRPPRVPPPPSPVQQQTVTNDPPRSSPNVRVPSDPPSEAPQPHVPQTQTPENERQHAGPAAHARPPNSAPFLLWPSRPPMAQQTANNPPIFHPPLPPLQNTPLYMWARNSGVRLMNLPFPTPTPIPGPPSSFLPNNHPSSPNANILLPQNNSATQIPSISSATPPSIGISVSPLPTDNPAAPHMTNDSYPPSSTGNDEPLLPSNNDVPPSPANTALPLPLPQTNDPVHPPPMNSAMPTTAPNNMAPPPQTNVPTPQRGFMSVPLFFFQSGGARVPTDSQGPTTHRERRKWTPPESVGKSLRQRVEQKERELGLRCDDAVCGVAPTDEDPIPSMNPLDIPQIQIHAAYDAQGKPCIHRFHPACLVTSARVADVTLAGGERADEEGEVQVACPACRAEGLLSGAEWEEGVRASEAEMA